MKWKIYQWCSWYNIIVCMAFSVLVFYFYMQRPVPGDLWSFLLAEGIFIAFGFKYWTGLKFLKNIKEKNIHRDRVGLLFYFLWLLNAAGTCFYIFLIYDSLKDISRASFQYIKALDIALLCLLVLAIPTLVYTLILDIPLERKARKQIDFAEELFKDSV